MHKAANVRTRLSLVIKWIESGVGTIPVQARLGKHQFQTWDAVYMWLNSISCICTTVTSSY